MHRRIEELVERLGEADVDCCVIAKPENVYYFTGVYPIEASFLIVSTMREPLLLVAPSSYAEAEERSRVEVVKGELRSLKALRQRLTREGCLPEKRGVFLRDLLGALRKKPLGIEGDYLPAKAARKLGRWRDISPIIAEMRMVKDAEEVRIITRAVESSEKALRRVYNEIAPGMAERELSGRLDLELKRLGADQTKARVRSGRSSAKPFSREMEGSIGRGPLLVDYGGAFEHYWTDLTRTFHVGRAGEDYEEVYSCILEAKRAALREIGAGRSISEVEHAVREVFREHSLEGHMVYTPGHGVGLEVHEPPVITARRVREEPMFRGSSDVERLYQAMAQFFVLEEEPVFRENMVLAIEPGLYFRDFGVRVEDMVLVKRRARLLSRFPDELEALVL
ncbi:MAG: aminopeptidase P family protein [Euryarchaeota archaeon]|nr:aminopeptidase P family protein [Euryarchaeota archaeon]